MRWEVVKEFERALLELNLSPNQVCIVGGASSDPEVSVIKKLFPATIILYAGIENYGSEPRWLQLDLNSENRISEKFDLVVCSQVIEHVWNLRQAFTNLETLLKPDGYLWINCPASNMAHGSPEYYSAGYSPEFLRRNLENLGFSTLICGSIGSERYYKTTHSLRFWCTEREHQRPFLGFAWKRIDTPGKLLEFLKSIPGRSQMLKWKTKVTHHIDYATETFFFCRKLTS